MYNQTTKTGYGNRNKETVQELQDIVNGKNTKT